MADQRKEQAPANNANIFKEAVCIDAGRIYDSCSDKDCLEDLQVFFTDTVQPMVDEATNVKAKSVEVLNVFLELEPVPFNRGFYSVDMTFFFLVRLSLYTSPHCPPTPIEGLATFCKKVILYGSEGNVKIFSTKNGGRDDRIGTNLPKATVQIVDPIILSCRFGECQRCERDHVNIPKTVCGCYDGDFDFDEDPKRCVFVTLGIFTIVQLERRVQMMVPVYDFCVPDKECPTTTENPCDLFKKIKFPTDEFFPPRLADIDKDCE